MTAAGVISQATKNIYTASHANPSKCAAEFALLTLDTIKIFQAAWQQSHDVTPHVVFPKSNLTPEKAYGDFETTEGEDPDPECNPLQTPNHHTNPPHHL